MDNLWIIWIFSYTNIYIYTIWSINALTMDNLMEIIRNHNGPGVTGAQSTHVDRGEWLRKSHNLTGWFMKRWIIHRLLYKELHESWFCTWFCTWFLVTWNQLGTVIQSKVTCRAMLPLPLVSQPAEDGWARSMEKGGNAQPVIVAKKKEKMLR